MKPVGKPDAGNPHVRFDERGGETGPVFAGYRAPPRLYNTNSRTGHVSEADGRIRSGPDSGGVEAVGTNSWASGGEHPALVRIGICLDAQKAARFR
jgi:hypothetical protein